MIKQNYKGWVAKDFVLATLIFSAGIALFVIMIGSIANDYNNTEIIDSEFSNKFDRFENDTETISQMWDAVTSEGGLSLVGATELLFFGTFRVISLVFSSVVSAGTQLAGFGGYFGVPSEITAIFFVFLFAAITVTIVFIVINSVRGGKEL